MSNDEKEVIVVDAQAVPEELKMSEVEAKNLRSDVISLRNTIESSYYQLGVSLKQVSERTLSDGVPLWKSWGFVSFDDYCERELGFRQRKAYYLLDVASAVEKGVFCENDVERLGWTKAASLAPLVNKGIINKKNVGDWISKTESKTCEELREMTKNAKENASKAIHEAKVTAEKSGTDIKQAVSSALEHLKVDEVTIPSKAPETIHVFRVGLPEEQWKVWQNALHKAKEITGSDKEPWLVECIGSAFLAECLNGREDLLKTLISRIEEAYEVKIMAVNHSGEVLHCHHDIAELARKVS